MQKIVSVCQISSFDSFLLYKQKYRKESDRCAGEGKYFSRENNDWPSGKSTNMKGAAAREAFVSWYHGGSIQGPPKTLLTLRKCGAEGTKGPSARTQALIMSRVVSLR